MYSQVQNRRVDWKIHSKLISFWNKKEEEVEMNRQLGKTWKIKWSNSCQIGNKKKQKQRN